MRFPRPRQASFPCFTVLAIVAIIYLVQLEIQLLRSLIKNNKEETSSTSLQSHASSTNRISQEKSFVDLSLNGGFCPKTSCTIGQTSIHHAFRVTPEAPQTVQSNAANNFITMPVDSYGTNTFQMLLRDPNVDTFISGQLATGRQHDPLVHNLVVRSLQRNNNLRRKDNNPSIFIDIGANIGYFTATALAVGATTISFEPFYENAGVLMSTITKNKGWADRATLYMNPLGYESNIVTMEPTNSEINLSNMHITGSHCASETENNGEDIIKKQRYGIDYMESVSLDQVMTTHHRDVSRIQLMKVDVETYEIQVFNGAMYTLCNTIVERIAVEVEYLKPFHELDIPCNFNKMRDTLVLMGYDILDLTEEQVLTNVDLKDMPPDIVFRLKDMTQTPAKRLGNGGYDSNPCRMFDI